MKILEEILNAIVRQLKWSTPKVEEVKPKVRAKRKPRE
jgi:hypothetical protein